MKAPTDTAQRHLAEQREYVKSRHLERQRFAAASGMSGSALVDDRMLAESMRSVRYKDEAHAAGDIIDNAIEAGATQVHVIYRTEGTAIREIAFVDDAAGIDETFLPHAIKWGGSSNEGRRNVFGRFGFGLPSASVNRGRRYRVISRTAGDLPFQQVGIDLDNLGAVDGVVPLPAVTEVALPDWVRAYVTGTKTVNGKDVPQFAGGEQAVRTCVVWGGFDRLEWPNRQMSSARFREHLGITYAGWLDTVRLFVDGETVEPVDVLFTTPGYRYYDIPGAPRADAQDGIRIEVADAHGVKHPVTVRYSLLSVAAYDAEYRAGDKGPVKKIRKRIRTEYNGIFVTRNGRFIELAKPKLVAWNNYARQVGVAMDFPPELDELFGVTPDKQTITFTERLENLLKSHGVDRSLRALNKLVEVERSQLKAERDAALTNDDGVRPSEEAIAKAVALDTRRSRKVSEETRREAQENLQRRVRELAKQTGIPEPEIEAAQEKQKTARPFRVEFVRQTEDDPFYTPSMEGVQTVLQINTEHPWYREVYSKLTPEQAEVRSGLEVMLWVLATSEIDSTDEMRIFYRAERREWSHKLANSLDLHPTVFNRVASRAEVEEDDATAWEEDDEAAPALPAE